MHSVYIPSQAVYSPWFDPRTNPPVRTGPYQVRSLAPASYKHLLGFRYFSRMHGIWRHSRNGPRCTVGRADLSYEWRGLLAYAVFDTSPTGDTIISCEEAATLKLLPAAPVRGTPSYEKDVGTFIDALCPSK